ncbi:MAG: hypothetical protein COB04_12970 [Gammaproteobacteria bacterium]|nr:MAG: hypothetical protein COB04_12970 [Gammaproteobacteria bacterium]
MKVFRFLLLAFLIMPIVEMMVLFKVGGVIGALNTVALVALTAVVGVWLLKMQGFATLRRVQEKMNAGELPGVEVVEGAFLLVGGALLLTPGFVTDSIGFACLLPWTRRAMAEFIVSKNILKPGQFSSFGSPMGQGFGSSFGAPPKSHEDDHRSEPNQGRDGETFDGEFKRRD